MPDRSTIRPRVLAAFVLAAFTLLAVLIAVLVATPRVGRILSAEVENIVGNALTSISLVDRLVLDNEREHRVLVAHVESKDPARMRELEKQLTAIEDDYAAAARQYHPLTVYSGETAAWQRLQDDVAALRQRVPGVLELSRQNRDGEAQRMLSAIEGRFDDIERDGRELIAINTKEAADAQQRIATLQGSMEARIRWLDLLGFLAMLGLVGLAISFFQRQILDARRVESLEGRNRELDAFAGRVAHDLRGLMTTIRLSANLLATRCPDERPTTARLERGVAQMDALTGDLLALSRIEADARGGRCDPTVVAAELEEELRPRVEAERGTLLVEVTPAAVGCKHGLLRQVLWNLLDNALNYRDPEVSPIIALRGRVDGRWYDLRVEDNGPGMSAEDARRGFEPFYRGTHVREQRPGTGLGLSIVKRVAEGSGGNVSVSSQPGRGTTFILRLPLAGDAPRPTPPSHRLTVEQAHTESSPSDSDPHAPASMSATS